MIFSKRLLGCMQRVLPMAHTTTDVLSAGNHQSAPSDLGAARTKQGQADITLGAMPIGVRNIVEKKSFEGFRGCLGSSHHPVIPCMV